MKVDNVNIHNPHNVDLSKITIKGDGALHIGPGAEIRQGTILEFGSGILKIGRNSVIGYMSFMQITGEIDIGAGTLIGPHCDIIASKHTVIPGKNTVELPLQRGKVTIGDNIWIGAHCTINCGVTIGDSSIIGANSFVNKSIVPGDKGPCVYGGVPAKFIKYVKDMK